MTDLRKDIKAAFARELAAHPSKPALRSQVMQGVGASEARSARQPRRAAPRLQWIAVAAAVLLTVAILASLVATHLARPTVPALMPPPSGLSVMYVIDPHDAAVLDAFDWDGRQRGQVRLPQAVDPIHGVLAQPAPGGSAFVFINRGRAYFLNRLGQPLPGVVGPGLDQGYDIWSDDGRGLCTLGYSAAIGWQLGLQSPGSQVRALAVVSHDPAPLSILACAFAADRAVLSRASTVGDTTDLWVVRLSDGSVVASKHFSPAWHGEFAVSPGAEYVASTSNDPSGPSSTTIGPLGGDPMANLPPTFHVLEFSGDGSLVLVSTGQGAAIMDWRSGRLVWTVADTSGGFSFLAEPGGNRFAVQTMAPGAGCVLPCLQPPGSITIVDSDGAKVVLPKPYVPLW